MKILFLSTWFPFPPDNGSKIRVYHLLRVLARAHHVTLIAFNPKSHAGFETPENVEIYPVQADPFRYVQLPQVVKYLSPVPLAFWQIKEMEATVNRLYGLGKWDAIVAVQAPVARYALQFTGVPRVLDVDTSLSYQLRERYQEQKTHIGRWRAWLSWYKAYCYERALFRQFQACAVVSSVEMSGVQAMVGDKSRVAVIPNGVDCEHNRPGLAEVRPHTLVYNGALTYSANYDAMQYFLAEVYPLIRQQVPDVSLTITGSTSDVDLTGLRLDESVYFSGYVEDIRPLVAGSAVCVAPIRQGGGTRLKILEALALGTPVVATLKGAEGLDVTDGEHLLLADDPAAFAKATLRLLREPPLHKRLAANARQQVKARYDWEQIGAQFVELVEEVGEEWDTDSRG